ncbi:MAG: hypothetical protein U9R17_04145 [Thermodesulfobacteriota bacterium]|nr:hypothetical protein [Thermodesulfobacteriota bacterium]
MDVDLDIKVLKLSKRNSKVSHARALISYLAVDQLGFCASEVARKLRISGMAVGKGVNGGKKIDDNKEIIKKSSRNIFNKFTSNQPKIHNEINSTNSGTQNSPGISIDMLRIPLYIV